MSGVEKPDDAKREPDMKKSGFLEVVSRPTFICLMLALVTVVLYRKVLGFDFIDYDDNLYVVNNEHVQRGLSWSNVSWAFHTTELASWYPLMWLSFMLDVTLFGRGAAGPHFVNLLFHAANAVLLFLTLLRLTDAKWRSAMVAALFALHPLHVESVAWVAERKDVLSTFFGLLSVWMFTVYVKGRIRDPVHRTGRPDRYYWWSLGFFVLALLSKPMQVTLPCVLLLLDFWPLKRMGRVPMAGLIREKIPFFVLSLVFAWVTVGVHHEADALVTLTDISIPMRLQNALVYYARYLGKTFWPAELVLPYPASAGSVGLTLGSVFLVVGLCVGAWWTRKRYPFLFTGWFWFVGTLFPVIGIIAWGSQSIADRFTYVPLIGIFIAVVWGTAKLLRRGKFPKMVPCALAAGVLVLCGWRTVGQLDYWRDSETLFRHTLVSGDENTVAHFCLAEQLMKTGRKAEATEHFRRAIELSPNVIGVLQGAGRSWFEAKDYDDAILCFQRILSISSTNTTAMCSLGDAWVEVGKTAEAMGEFTNALRLDPKFVRAYCGLGNALAVLGKNDEALQNYTEALRLDPDSALAHYDLGNVLLKTGDTNGAMLNYASALQSEPTFAEAENNLGNVMLRLGRVSEAAEHFQAVTEYEPGHVEAHVNLASALARQRNLGGAVAEYSEALELDPNLVEAHFNVAVVLAQLGRREEAVAHLKEVLRLRPDLAVAKQLMDKLEAGK
ncbi:MAG TPA: tetratricopeptide repeat protein [Verrucomicrobiae bacterium]|nr:tetratricopeptide repeat protein [Verrucomicrobiae bacterium]